MHARGGSRGISAGPRRAAAGASAVQALRVWRLGLVLRLSSHGRCRLALRYARRRNRRQPIAHVHGPDGRFAQHELGG